MLPPRHRFPSQTLRYRKMECANAVCRRGISQPRYCPVCKKLAYCSQQCRLDHWYAGHQLSCGMEQVQSGSKFRLEDFRDEEQKIRILGKGSYGEVKLVIHIPTGEKYALKVVVCRQINKAQFQKHNSLQVMKREILLHRALDHPHIIKLHDHMEDAENVYLVLELALRGSLFYEIRRHKKLGEEKAREYFRQTCEGVQYLHDHQIIHRDLKPENILLDSSGSLKICDFGWCAKGTETRTTFCGTLDYMAPEMVVGGGHTFSVDLWALGVLLYELVHGTAPFTARKDSEKCQQILGTKFTLDSALSLDLKDLINGLLQADPDDRLSLSQVLSHPWVVGRAKENSLLGARLKKFLHGVGVVEGVVTAVEGDCCTVEYENAAGREQIPATEIARMIKRKKGRLEQGKESEEVSPLPSGSQSPIEEAALLNQIEQWCKAPSQLPLQLSTLKLVKSETNMVAAELEMQPMIHAEPEEEAKGEVMNAHKVRPPSLPAFEMDSDMERGQGEKNGVFSDDVSSDFSNPPVAESRTAADPPKRSDSSKPLFSMSDDQCEPRHTAGFSPMELETFDFEHERQMIEEKNQMFYCETEERWAFRDSQGSVVPAPQLRTRDPQADSGGSNSLIEEIEKLASLTKRGPEDPVIHLQAIEKANEALTLRKNQLEALLKEIEGTPPFPRVRKPMDLRFRDEGKGGFLRWIGSVIGCADRAK